MWEYFAMRHFHYPIQKYTLKNYPQSLQEIPKPPKEIFCQGPWIDPKKEKYKKLEITQPKRIFIFGHHKEELSNLISHPKVSTHNSLREIFEILCDQEDCHDLLFSPGNPSGNDYANYIERGDHFNKLKAEYFD